MNDKVFEQRIKEYKKQVVIVDKFKSRVEDLKAQLQVEAENLKRIEDDILKIAESNKATLFKSKKSVEMQGCKIGYSQTTGIEINKATTLEKLKELFDGRCVKQKEEVDVKALASFTDNELEQIDAERKTTDKYYVKAV